MVGLQTIVELDSRQIHGELHKEIAMLLNGMKLDLKIYGFLWLSVVFSYFFSFFMGFIFLFRLYIKRKYLCKLLQN